MTTGQTLDAVRLDPVCPHPIARPFMRQRWEDVEFAHWPVPADVVADIRRDTGLVRAAGFAVKGAPVAHWASGVSVRAAAPKRIHRLRAAAEPITSGR